MVKIDVIELPRKEDKRLSVIPKGLFKAPFRGVITAPTESGKSNLVRNFVFKFYRQYFDEIYIWIASLDDARELEILTKKYRMVKRIKILTEWIEEDVLELYKDLETEEKPPRTLFVVDDMIYSNISKHHKNQAIDKIMMNGRHANISILLTTQKYTKLNASTRSINLSFLIVFATNINEMKQIAMEHSNNLSEEEMIQLMKEIFKKKYSFLCVNYQNDFQRRFLSSNFRPLLITTDKDKDDDSE